MRHDDAGVGHELGQPTGDLVNVANPVVDEEDLALAQQLAANGLGNRRFVVLPHVGQNRAAISGRRGDH